MTNETNGTNEKNETNLKVYEQALVVTIFAVFFPLMLATLNDNFIPQQVVTPVWLATVVSAISIVSFTGFSSLIFFYYLHSVYGDKLQETWKDKCSFGYFIKRCGLRTLAVGGAPLGLFYGEAFTLYSILRGAFEGGAVPYRYAYTFASFVYFTIWAAVYIAESYWGRKKQHRNKWLTWYLMCLYFSLCLILILLWAGGILNPKW